MIDRAVRSNDHVLFNRLQHRIANKGEAPSTPSSSSFPPPNYPTTPTPKGNAMSNGYAQSPFSGYQQSSQQARTSCQKIRYGS